MVPPLTDQKLVLKYIVYYMWAYEEHYVIYWNGKEIANIIIFL